MLFHHDPLHSEDFLDAVGDQMISRWTQLGGRPHEIELATSRREIVMSGPAPHAAAAF